MTNMNESVGGFLKRGLDATTVYRLVKLMSSDYTKWPAYKTGVMDAEGKIITPKKERTKEQKESFTLLHRLIRNIKNLISKLPFGKSLFGSLTAAYFLLREAHTNPFGRNLTERFEEFQEEQGQFLRDLYEICESDLIDAERELQENTTTAAVQIADKPMHFDWKPTKMMGMRVFDVDTNYYMKSKDGKRKYDKYSKYVGEDANGEEIRQYAINHPKRGIILRDSRSGSMTFLRKPRK